MISLEDKSIFITGAARRVGRAIALAIANTGGDILLHYHGSESAAQETKLMIEQLGRKCQLLQGDLSKPAEAERIIHEATKNNALYALINNASIYKETDLANLNPENWDLNMNLHAYSALVLSRGFSKALGDRNGRIINMLDWEIERPDGRRIPYIVSKAALGSITKLLAVELAPAITVNALALGAILPPEEGQMESDPEKVPIARWGQMKDVTETLLFLLTGPDFITGEILHVDGGRHLI
jgi:pteridine reductase